MDAGVDADLMRNPDPRSIKARRGSRDFLEEPAVTEDEMRAVLEPWVDVAGYR